MKRYFIINNKNEQIKLKDIMVKLFEISFSIVKNIIRICLQTFLTVEILKLVNYILILASIANIMPVISNNIKIRSITIINRLVL